MVDGKYEAGSSSFDAEHASTECRHRKIDGKARKGLHESAQQRLVYSFPPGCISRQLGEGCEDGGEDGEVRVGTISSLEHFGESAVQSLDDKNGRGAAPVREATVTAESAELQVLRLSRDDFTRLHRSGVLDASVVAELQRVRTARQVENRRTLSLVSRSSTGGGGVDL